jgi:Domain of unknown function (DUF4623)/PEP-CTERM motif
MGQLWQPVVDLQIPSTMSSKPFQLAIALLAAAPAFAQAYSLESFWTVAPVDASTFPDTGNLTRGGGFNPVTGNFLVSTRAGGTGVRVLSGTTGSQVGTLNMTGVSGGTFALNMIGVAADGAIYGANLTTGSTGTPLRVYRWANEGAEPTLIYSGDPGAGRFGDSFAVRGSGSSTEIIMGQGLGGSQLFHLGTADGSTFAATTITVPGITAGDLRLGLDFGDGNTIFAKQAGALRYVTYDIATSSAVLNASYTLGTGGGTPGPLGVYENVLVAYGYAPTTGPNSINIYDVTSLLTTGTNLPADSELLPTTNANSNAVGAVDFNADGSIVYVVTPNNGVHAFRVVPEPGTWALLGAGTLLLGWTLRRRS